MGKDRFKVIKGRGKKTPVPNYRFKKGYATNTRLMGVVGMKLFWETEEGDEYVQFFHLDCEEYGIDGFESLANASGFDIEIVTAKMMGGLGGTLVEIEEQEGIYLLNEVYKINLKNDQSIPGFSEEYEYLLQVDMDIPEETKENLWKKICEDIVSETQLINYYLMRAVGMDKSGQHFLSEGDNYKNFEPTMKPSTLIKNVVEFSGHEGGTNYYNCESVIDLENGYQLIISEIGVKETDKGLKVVYSEVKNKMKISTIEAVFQLKKPEYLLVYSVEDFIEAVELMDELKPHAMQNIHQGGFLYTEFNPTNDHVKDEIYYLNGDIYAVYFITTQGQMVVSTFLEENLEEIKVYFEGKIFEDLFELESEFKIESPLLYEFVQSGLGNFYEFINRE
jgi:hypothetical protein